jgi:hypothetical protein
VDLQMRQGSIYITRAMTEHTTVCTDLIIPVIGSALLAKILLGADAIKARSVSIAFALELAEE